jgi:hypothetical protein
VSALRTALAAGDRDAVPARLATIRSQTGAARRLTTDPVWRALSHVPYAGRSLVTVGGLAAAADDLARTTLPDVDRASATLSLRSLRTGDRVDLAPLAAAVPPLERVRDSVARTRDRVRRLPAALTPGPVRNARTAFLDELDGLYGTAADAATATRVAPAMLGRDGPRRYFVAILNNAEMRASGGLLGAYGILVADRGRLSMRTLGTNADLTNTTPKPAVAMDADFVARYRRFSSDSFWLNGNMSPHFPAASRVWTALWAKTHHGERLDGTIAVDPVALSGILRATGPATLPDGERITAGNVVPLTESVAYQRFAKDNDARDRYLQAVARASYQQLVSAPDTVALVRALGSAAGTRHLQLASEHPDEEQAIAGTPLAGVLPETAAPYLEVVTQNAGGNKLDYYVRRTITWQRLDTGRVRVEVHLTNSAPPGLPQYVSGRLDLPGLKAPISGQQHVYLSVYATAGAGLLGATLDGVPTTMESEVERGHPVFSAFVDADPGHELVLALDLADTTSGVPYVREPPLVAPDNLRITRKH